MWAVTYAMFVLKHPQYPEVKKYCLVDEGKLGWFFPGGGVDGHETPLEGGMREVVEEAGVEVDPDKDIRLLQVETHTDCVRYVFSGTAKSEALKTHADEESNGARWVTIGETKQGKFAGSGELAVPNPWLRSDEVLERFEHVERDRPSYSIVNDDLYIANIALGAKGKKTHRRDLYISTFQCVLACQIEGTNEFIMAPGTESNPRLPSFKCNTALAEPLATCAEKGAMSLGIATGLKGVLAIQDARNIKNELDFRVSFYTTIPANSSLAGLQTTKAENFKNDEFDARTVRRALRGALAVLSVVA